MTITELRKYDTKKKRASLIKNNLIKTICCLCKSPCSGHYTVSDGVSCADCHYDSMGELIKQVSNWRV